MQNYLISIRDYVCGLSRQDNEESFVNEQELVEEEGLVVKDFDDVDLGCYRNKPIPLNHYLRVTLEQLLVRAFNDVSETIV